MEVQITILIEVDRENFDEDQFSSDILDGFEERFGYDIQQLDIDSDE